MNGIYVAGHCVTDARQARDALIVAGLSCTASWIDDPGFGSKRTVGEDASVALTDLDEVRASAGMIVILPRDPVPGGMWVEYGMALALGLPVVVVAPHADGPHAGRRNLFCALSREAGSYAQAASILAAALRGSR